MGVASTAMHEVVTLRFSLRDGGSNPSPCTMKDKGLKILGELATVSVHSKHATACGVEKPCVCSICRKWRGGYID